MIRALLIRWLILAVAVWATTAVVPGINVDGSWGTYLLIAIVLATVNALLGSILRALAFPLIVLSLGLFSLVITALMLLITAGLMDTFEVENFGDALLGAIVIAVVTMILQFILAPLQRRKHRQPARRR
jgi:putative membrane protein